MARLLKGCILALLGIVALASAALAHKVTIFAWVEKDTIHTQSKFSGGKPVKGGTVEVFGQADRLLLTGHTDDDGHFSFSVPAIADLTLVLTAGMGHRNTWRLTAAELGGVAPAPAPAPAVPVRTDGPMPAPALSAEAVEEIVARQLERQLQPLIRQLMEARDPGPTLKEVIGGLGYLLGLVGLGTYLRFRKGATRS